MTQPLPAEFWSQHPEALGDEALQLIYAEVSQRLKNENPDADTLELMLIERVAFLYVHIRNKENKKLFAHDRAYKETLQLWGAMAADLRKRRERVSDVREITERILAQVQVAVDVAVDHLPAEQAKVFQSHLLEAFDQQGL